MDSKELLLEEIRHIRARYSEHEKRRYQMLALCATGYATALGFSDTIPHEIIPFILSLLLLLTSFIAIDQYVLQKFNTEYLIALQEKLNFLVSIERAYDEIHKYIISISKTIFIGPFTLLALVGILATAYFSNSFIKELWQSKDYVGLFVYLTMLLLMYFLVFLNISRIRRLNLLELRKKGKEFLDSSPV